MIVEYGDCVRVSVDYIPRGESLGLVSEVFYSERTPDTVTGIRATMVTGMQYLFNTEEFELLAQV